MPQQLVAIKLLPEQSPLDKVPKEIIEKIDKAEKTFDELMLKILIEKTKLLEE